MSDSLYYEIEQAWLDGDLTYSEACSIADELGYGEEEDRD